MDGMTKDVPAIPDGYEDEAEFLEEARERFQQGLNADSDNRLAAEEDLRFLTGEGQWDPQVKAARLAKGRPCLTINTLPQYVGQVIGDIRTNRPSIKVRPAEDSDKDKAEIRQGLIRYIENQSRALSVYALAGEDQVSCGIGHFRIGLEYSDDASFDQDIRIRHIPNPLNVVWDPLSVEPTGADARFCFVVDTWDKKVFEKAYPDAQTSELTVPMTNGSGWFDTDAVRVTEYWIIKETKTTLTATGTGGKTKTRQVTKKSACMYLISGKDVLDGPYEYPIDRIPVFRVAGREIRVGEKRFRFGLVRFAKDPVRMKNLWRSSAAEWLAQAPKQQWLLHAADEQEANRYRNAGKSGDSVLTYSGQIAPQRIDPPTAPSALLQEAQFADQDIKDVTGLHDASLGIKSNETSGKAILARERQGDVATYMYHDNLSAAICECGRVANDFLPVVYDTARTVTLLGEDEVARKVRINDPNGQDGHIDLGSGKYDIVVETGPSYSTKRVEAAESMMAFVQAVPAAGQIAGDLIAAAQDWPMADAIAERMKKALPPGLVDVDPNDMSPEQQQAQAAAMQAHQQQQAMQQKAMELELGIKDAERQYKLAQAAKLTAEAQAAGEGEGAPSNLDNVLKIAQIREANAKADLAEAQAAAALASVPDPIVAEVEAAQAAESVHQARLDTAHRAVDLHQKLNPPDPEDAADQAQPGDSAED